jgi:hypothetical protein
MNYGREITRDDPINADAVKAMIEAPPVITRLERFLTNTVIRNKLIAFLSDPAHAALDVSNRLVVGRWRAGGAHADVYDGVLITSKVDYSAIRRCSKDRDQIVKYLGQNPVTFKKVAIKQIRYYNFLKDHDRGSSVRGHLHHPENLRLTH